MSVPNHRAQALAAALSDVLSAPQVATVHRLPAASSTSADRLLQGVLDLLDKHEASRQDYVVLRFVLDSSGRARGCIAKRMPKDTPPEHLDAEVWGS